MAAIDYGALVFKNGEFINRNTSFQDMEEVVRWSDKGLPTFSQLYGNYFAYVGDEYVTIGFYKYYFSIKTRRAYEYHNYNYGYDCHKCAYNFNIDGMYVHARRLSERYPIWKCEILYNGNRYTVVYGYGIDTNIGIWNQIKYKYLKEDKAVVRRVDRILEHFNVKENV